MLPFSFCEDISPLLGRELMLSLREILSPSCEGFLGTIPPLSLCLLLLLKQLMEVVVQTSRRASSNAEDAHG